MSGAEAVRRVRTLAWGGAGAREAQAKCSHRKENPRVLRGEGAENWVARERRRQWRDSQQREWLSQHPELEAWASFFIPKCSGQRPLGPNMGNRLLFRKPRKPSVVGYQSLASTPGPVQTPLPTCLSHRRGRAC